MTTRMSLFPSFVDTRHEYFWVFHYYVPIGIAVFAIIALLSLFLVVKNRRRAPEQASRRFSNERLEGSYALLLTCIVAFLLWVTFSAEHRTDTVANHVKPYTTIHVYAARWEWTFYYPQYHITVQSGTTGMSTFVVPVNRPIRFLLTSEDVIHDFWIPQLEFKHDLIHGKTQYQTLTFTSLGTFQGQCAVYCGLRHGDMLFSAKAVSLARFRAWARSGGKAATT